MNMSLEGNILHLDIDLSQNLGPSKSGKTLLVASTHGNVPILGTDALLSVNVMRKNPDYVPGK